MLQHVGGEEGVEATWLRVIRFLELIRGERGQAASSCRRYCERVDVDPDARPSQVPKVTSQAATDVQHATRPQPGEYAAKHDAGGLQAANCLATKERLIVGFLGRGHQMLVRPLFDSTHISKPFVCRPNT